MKSAFLALRFSAFSRRLFGMSALGIAAIAMAQQTGAQAHLAAPTSGLINPRAIAFTPATGKVYAVDSSHAAVLIYRAGEANAKSVRVGREPVSLAVNTANGKAYVANGGDGTVSVIDGSSDAVVATVPIGSRPYSIAVNSVTGKVYATHTFDDRLSIIDGDTNTATALKTGSTDLIAINSETNTIYLLGYEGGTVLAIDGAKRTMRKLQTGIHAWGINLDEKSGTIFVTLVGNAAVAALRKDSSAAAYLPAGAIPCSIAFDSKSNRLYVANYGDDSITVMDEATGTTSASVSVGRHPKAVVFDAKRKMVYVANTSDDSVTVIDAANNTVLATLPAGKNPYALAAVPGGNKLYVANESDDNASTVVDLSRIQGQTP
jgi:YVTN family beta-propeller protein